MSNLFIDPWTLTAASLLIKASVVVAMTAGVCAVLRHRSSAATRHLLCTLMLVSVLTLPLLSVVGPSWRIAIPSIAPVPSVETASASRPSHEPAGAHRQDLVDLNPGTASAPASASSAAPPAAPFQTAWRATAIAVYAAGVLLLLLQMVIERMSVARLVRRADAVTDLDWRRLLRESAASLGVEGPVRLLRSREQTMPMAFGIRTRSILLPAIADTWAEDRRRAVLLHELAHVARHDCLSQAVAAFTCALYWVHPGVWWMARRLRVERELACDDRVIEAGTTAREYAGHLLELAYSLGGHRAPALVVTMARPKQLEGRMLAILDDRRNRAIPGRQYRLAATAIAAAIIVPLASAEGTVVPADATYVVEAPAYAGAPMADRVTDHDRDAAPAARPEPRPIAPSAAASRSINASDDTEEGGPGTWDARPSMKPDYVYLQLRGLHWSSGSDVALKQLEGLSAQQLQSGSGPVRFTLRRDAGTFAFNGILGGGVGAGTYTFEANPSFAAELEKRGLGRPTAKEQYRMARSDVSLAFVDELKAQNYTGVTTSELVRAGDHGVNSDYLRAMGELGYRVDSLDSLITLRDHGVSPDYVRQLQELGYKKLTVDELRTARDHGVTPDYVRQLAELGYKNLTIEELRTARDHGVTPDYVKQLVGLGYKLSIEELRNARDHGVTAEFVSGMKDLGHASLPIEQLVNIRDHGVTPEFARQMSELGLSKVPVDQLVKMRDHGVTPDFVRDLAALGYKGLDVDALVRLRDHGVTPGYIRELKDLGYTGLPVDELVTLRDHGVTPDRIRKANARAGAKLPPDMLRAFVDGGMQ
jgi:beta-lactamase regulating signal transducer with metallopeptidase domain